MSIESTIKNDQLIFSLRAIYVRDSSAHIVDGFDPLLPGQALHALFRTGECRGECRVSTIIENGIETVHKSCPFTTRFEFVYLHDGNHQLNKVLSDDEVEQTTIAKITADITVDYLVNTESFPEPEVLNQWAQRNVLLHGWPYWREFCQSTMLRMNLPVTMIPLVTINARLPTEQKESEQKTEQKKTRPKAH